MLFSWPPSTRSTASRETATLTFWPAATPTMSLSAAREEPYSMELVSVSLTLLSIEPDTRVAPSVASPLIWLEWPLPANACVLPVLSSQRTMLAS